MAKRAQDVFLQVEYVPLPVEREASWRAGVSLLEIGRDKDVLG